MKITKTKLTQLIKETILEAHWDPEEPEGQTDLERLVGDLTAESGLDYTEVMERLEDGFREKLGSGDVDIEHPLEIGAKTLDGMISGLVDLLEGADRQALNDYLLEIEAMDKNTPAFKIADAIYDVILDLGESAGYVDK